MKLTEIKHSWYVQGRCLSIQQQNKVG